MSVPLCTPYLAVNTAVMQSPDNVKCVNFPCHTAERVNKIISVEGVEIEITTVDI
jgi:hypothetical protein